MSRVSHGKKRETERKKERKGGRGERIEKVGSALVTDMGRTGMEERDLTSGSSSLDD